MDILIEILKSFFILIMAAFFYVYIPIHILITIIMFISLLFEGESFCDSFMTSIVFLFWPVFLILFLIFIIVVMPLYFLIVKIKKINLNSKLNHAKTNLIIYKKEHFLDLIDLFFEYKKEGIYCFDGLNNCLINLNQQNLIVKKTNKSKEEIKETISQKISFDFNFDEYFIFIENEKLKQIQQKSLIKELKEEIFDQIFELEDFKEKIKVENEKNDEEIKKSKKTCLKEILNEDNSTLKISNSNQINLENSIKEIKN